MQWIIFIGVAVVSWLVQMNLQNKFKKYSQIPTNNGMTGADVARKMLNDNGIYDVQVTHTPGHLTDHYNPANKTVNLSESVYSSNSIMAAAVAAHECGHALQHARAYAPLTMRSKLVPVVSFASSIMTWVILAGILMINSFPELLLIGIILLPLLRCSASSPCRSRSMPANVLWYGLAPVALPMPTITTRPKTLFVLLPTLT